MEMKNRFQEAIQNVQRQRHLARRSVAMVLVLAMLTAMSVSWRLHQDGIALTADDTRYYCGKEEHKHTDDCYIEGTEPICGYEEDEIVEETMDSADDAGDGDASVADWDEAGSEPESEPATQEEPEPEVVLHHHTADCYEEEEVLTCGIESDHVHQDYCYDQETGELLCTEHEHTDDCYTLEEVLVCGQEEGEPEKTDDGAALYDVDENSAVESDSAEEPETAADPEPEQEATKPETDDEIDTGYTVHHHTAECYGKVLICGKEEHEHTAACLVNPNAEIDAEYDAKTPDRTSVDWAQDMVLVAQSQLGYTESKADVDEDGNGYTMYADQYYKDKPMVYADWDSTFVAYCLYHAGVPQDIIPQYASISALRGELARMNSEYYTDDPQEFASILPGDIVMYKNAEGRETIGVVSDAAVDEETDLTTALTVISGDVATGCESDGETTIDQVAEVEVALNDVTSFVSVNAAEGYGISDLMDGDDAALAAEVKNLTNCITNVTATETSYKSDGKEGYKSNLKMDFKIPKEGLVADEYKYLFELPDGVALDSSVADKLLGQELEIAGEGSVKEGYFKFVKKEDGTYAIHLKFNKEYLDHTTTVRGYINFWSEFGVGYETKTGTVEIPFNEKTKLEIPSKEIKHPDNETNIYDIGVTKKGSYTEDGKLTYTVNVVSKKGTPGEVSYEDAITNLDGLTLEKPTIVVEKRTVTETRARKEDEWGNSAPSDWAATTGDKLEGTADGKISGTLPKMETEVSENGLERTYTEYQVTYTYDVKNLGDKDYTLKNKVSTSSRNDNGVEIKKDADKTVEINNQYTLKKTASYEDGKIKWTITFNENNRDIAGAVLSDSMTVNGTKISDVFATAEDIKIEPETGWKYIKNANDQITGIKFTAEDGKTNTEKYKITYTTKHEQAGSDYKVNNTAHAELPGGGNIDTGKEVTVPKYNVGKFADESNVTEENNSLTIPWKMSIDFTNTASIAQGTAFCDNAKIRDTHWLTKAQAKKLVESLQWSDTAYTSGNLSESASDTNVDKDAFRVEFYTKASSVSSDLSGKKSGEKLSELADDAKIYGFRIIAAKDVTPPDGKKVLKINYSTTADISDVKDKADYRNIFENIPCSYNYSKSTITKTDGEGKTGISTVISDDNSITWKIKVKTNSVGLHEKLTVKDVLPVGVKLKSIQVSLPYNGSIGPLEFSADKTTVTKNHNRDKLTGTYDPETNVLTMVLENPDGKLKQGFTYEFTVRCEVVSDKEGGTIAPGMTYEFENKASGWFDAQEDAPIGEVSQTQNWSQKENKTEVEPLSKRAQSAGDQYGGRKMNYTVAINPDGVNLLQGENSSTLTVTDILSVQVHPDYICLKDKTTLTGASAAKVTVNASLDEKNIKLCYASKDANGNLVAGSAVQGYGLEIKTYTDPQNSSRMLYKITLSDLPDGYAMLLSYTYELESNIDTVYPNWWSYGYWKGVVTNTASLEGTSYKSAEYKDKHEYSNAGAGGGVYRDHALTIKKVESGKYYNVLPGAEFKLQQYDGTQFVDVEGKTYTTNEKGQFTIEKSGADYLTNTLYRLVEITPPNGYALPENPEEEAVYFYFKDDSDTTHILPTDIPAKAIDLNSESKQVYVENEPNLTSVTVEKKWNNSDGTPLASPPDSIDFDLVMYSSKEKPVSGKSATVIGQIVNTANNKVRMTFAGDTLYTEDTVMTLKVTYPRRVDIQYNGGIVPVIYWNNQTISPVKTEEPENESSITWVYECKLKAGENQIYGKLANNGDSHNIEATYQSPTQPTNTAVKRIHYTLSSSDKWRMTIPNLPRSDKDEAGSTVYYSYKVEEINTSADYQVSYSTTNGVTSGLITMVNTKKPDKPDEPVYELPSTGSPGGTVPYTAGGAAIALAAVLCGYNSRRKRKRGEE